jgi:D-3-phosphoglycerate dehydrogenase
MPERELIAKMKQVHLLGIRSKTQLTKNVLAASPKLLAAGAFCIGTNQIDMDYATSAGVAIFNAPYSNTRSVAEMVIGHCVSLMRRIQEKNILMHQGIWDKSADGCHEVRGKTLGIVGYGHIGSQVSVLAESLGMQVLFYDVEPRLSLGNARMAASLDQLLKQSHIVTLHVPGSDSTRNMMNGATLRKMRKGSVLINLSRGDVMDAMALKSALERGHLSGAAIDVFQNEPQSNDEPFSSVFQGMHNVILTPHIGGSTAEAQESIGYDVASKLISFLESGASVGCLSVPSLSLPVQLDAHRLLHIHRNVPGVLSDINGLLSSMKVNILGQYLKTNSNIGYVVVDVDRKTSSKVLDALTKVKNTIRVRQLY